MKIILASSSVSRRKLLQSWMLDFEVVSPDIGYAVTRIKMAKLSKKIIDNYVQKVKVTSYAGGYNIIDDSKAGAFIIKFEGSFTNVLGLPMEKILPILRKISQLNQR